MRIILLGTLAGLMSCGAGLSVNGRWNALAAPVTIDGSANEWTEELQTSKDTRIMTAFRNDKNYLYLCLIPVDRGLGRQMLMQGFTVWFDPAAGRKKTLGLKYPIGTPPPATMGQKNGPDDFEEMMRETMTDMELLRPAVFGQERVKIDKLPGVKAAIQIVDGRLVYELQFPVHDQGMHPYFIGVNAGDEIMVGLELNQPARPATLAGARGPGAGGVRPGGPAGGQRPGAKLRGMRMEPGKFELWIKARLALGKDDPEYPS